MATVVRKVSIGFWFFAGIALFCGFGAVAWILFRFAAPHDSFDDKRAKARADKLVALRKENDAKLNHYAWISKDKGAVQIPIAQAMELAANELKSKTAQPSAVKVESPYPFGLQPAPSAPVPAPGTPTTNAPELKK